MEYPLNSYFVPNGVRAPYAWGCRCQIIGKTETEYTLRMHYNNHEFRLRIADFPNTNWIPHPDISRKELLD